MDGVIETIVQSVGVERVIGIVRDLIARSGTGTENGLGWKVAASRSAIPNDAEWFEFGGVTFYREKKVVAPDPPPPRQRRRKNLSCPVCGAEAFPQSVCPNCAKGRAGIKKMWVCGENSDHVFYTE